MFVMTAKALKKQQLLFIKCQKIDKNVDQCPSKHKMVSSNVFSFTDIEELRSWKIFTIQKLDSENVGFLKKDIQTNGSAIKNSWLLA